MLICYPSCKKCKNILIKSIDSIEKNNEDIIFIIFNNKINHFYEYMTEKTDEYEYSKEDLIEIHKHCKNLLIINIDKWMDIFDEVKPLKNQTNTYARLLYSRVFQKLINVYESHEDGSHEDGTLKEINRIENNTKNNIIKDVIEVLQEKQKFIYSDEDVYCNGNIDKFWNLEFDENILGFIDRNIYGNDKYYFLREQYMNAGLLQFKLLFNILDGIKLINILIIEKIFNNIYFHDQIVLNFYSKYLIDCYTRKTVDVWIVSTSITYNQLKLFNICIHGNIEMIWKNMK